MKKKSTGGKIDRTAKKAGPPAGRKTTKVLKKETTPKKEGAAPKLEAEIFDSPSRPIAVQSSKRKEQVAIRQVDKAPLSPFVIEFKTREEVIEASIIDAPPVFAAPVTEKPAPKPEAYDRQALEDFFCPPSASPSPIQAQSAPQKPFHLPQLPKSRLPALPTLNFSRYGQAIQKLRLSSPALRAAAYFAIIALLFTAPAAGLQAYTKFEQTKSTIALRGKETVLQLTDSNLAPQELSRLLGEATRTFTEAKSELEDAAGILKNIIPLLPAAGPAYRSGTLLLDAGAHLAEAGSILAAGTSQLSESRLTLGARLLNFEESTRAAFPLIRAATLELKRVKISRLPASFQEDIKAVRAALSKIGTAFAQTIELLPALQNFLGLEAPQRHLVVFQNPHELRATGGFIGSFALLDVDRGEIQNIEVPGGGPYDLACCLKEWVIAPNPLHLIEPRWQFHDANWFPDFPSSAQKLAWFYGRSGGPSVDGVIAVNATLIPKLLKIVGPVALPAYGREFTAANFIEETQKIVELEYDREKNQPKAVIGDLTPVLLERLLNAESDQLLPILEVFGEALLFKEIQLWSPDEEIQSVFSSLGWSGEIKNTAGDYLMVVSSNIAGGKSNAKIETQINHTATIRNDGNLIDRVEITKTHLGQKGELFSGVRNVDYLRVMVPVGSQLLEARGFQKPPEELFEEPEPHYQSDEDLARLIKHIGYESSSGTTITLEHGKTVFGGWAQTDPGETSTITLTYLLPPTALLPADRGALTQILGLPERHMYTFLAQAQSGAGAQLLHKVKYPPELKKIWGRDEFSGPLYTDRFWAILFEK